MNELVEKFPKVFIKIIDEHNHNDEMFAINNNARLEDLFDVYSKVVHYIDGEIIIILEKLIREKIEETTKNKEKRRIY